jgi:hypothetical protein
MAKEAVYVRLPESVIEALEEQATQKFISVSHMVRSYVLAGLAADGLHPKPPGPVRRRAERRDEHAAA